MLQLLLITAAPKALVYKMNIHKMPIEFLLIYEHPKPCQNILCEHFIARTQKDIRPVSAEGNSAQIQDTLKKLR